MRVVYLIDSLIAGGAERSLAAVAPHYRRLGIQLDVGYFYERDNVWRPALEAAGAEMFSLAGNGGRAGRALRAGRLVRRRRPDLVHTTLFEADIAGRLGSLGTRVPVVCSLVNEAYGPEQLADPRLKRWKVRAAQTLDAVTARRVTRFHAVSESVAEVMARRLRIARDRIDVIPRGRDPDELGTRSAARRAAARTALGVGDDDFVVLAVGRHEFQKGFEVLLRAFARSRARGNALRLFIAGREGAATPALRSLADELGLGGALVFLGFRDDVPELLCAADVFVSASRWEGSPGGILEAMALEVPIIASDIPAVREVLGDPPCGLLVPTDDPDSLADGLALVRGSSAHEHRTAAARDRFLERYTVERAAREMASFYARAAGVDL